MKSYQGKTVLLTGASSGLGREMALAFAREGAFVGMIARRRELLQELQEEISNEGGRALALPADVADPEVLHQALIQFIDKAGRLDVLVNNAGIGIFGRLPSEAEYQQIFEVNVHSVYRLSQAAVPYLARTQGCILNIGSAVTDRPFAGELVYSTTKGAVTALTKAMAAAYGKQGIRVNLISPGIIATEFNVAAGIPPEMDKIAYTESHRLNALPHTGAPGDVAAAALFLCADRARFITGEVVKVDGGMSMGVIQPA